MLHCPSDDELASLIHMDPTREEEDALGAHVRQCSACGSKIRRFRRFADRIASSIGAEDAAGECPDIPKTWSYLSRTCDERERESFEAHVAGCARCAELLAWLAGGAPEHPEENAPPAVPASVLQRLAGMFDFTLDSEGRVQERKARRRPDGAMRRWWPRLLGTAAAVAFVALGVWKWGLTPGRPETPGTAAPEGAVATLASPTNALEVFDRANRRWSAVSAGCELRSGAQVKVTGESASLVLADGSTVSARRETVLRATKERSGHSVAIEQGTIFVSAAKQPAGSRLSVTTADGRVDVKGTRFEVVREGGRTVVSVVEGTVECVAGTEAASLGAGYRQSMKEERLAGAPEKIRDPASIASWARGPVRSPAPNLLANPGAEDLDGDKPRMWSLYVADLPAQTWGATSERHHGGDRCAFLRIETFGKDDYACAGLVAGDSDGYSGHSAYRVEPNARYRFSFWIEGSGFKRAIGAGPWFFAEDGAFKGRDRRLEGALTVVPTAQWTHHEGEFAVPPGASKAVLVFFVYALKDRDVAKGATVFVDDVSLAKVQE